MNGQNNTDVVQLFVVLAAAIFGPSMSEIIGPYILIICAAVTGAAWSLGRKKPQGKYNAWAYFLRIAFTAILLTVAISKLFIHFIPALKEEWLIAPVALIIGLIGDDWYPIGNWIIGVLKQFIEKKINKE